MFEAVLRLLRREPVLRAGVPVQGVPQPLRPRGVAGGPQVTIMTAYCKQLFVVLVSFLL